MSYTRFMTVYQCSATIYNVFVSALHIVEFTDCQFQALSIKFDHVLACMQVSINTD